MARLAEVDELDWPAALDGLVDAGDRVGADDLGPVVGFLEDPAEGRGVLEGRDLAASLGARVLQ